MERNERPWTNFAGKNIRVKTEGQPAGDARERKARIQTDLKKHALRFKKAILTCERRKKGQR